MCHRFRNSVVYFLVYLLIKFSPAIATELKVAPPPDTVSVGDTVIVRFFVNDVYNLFGAGFDLSYPSDDLEYLKSIEGNFLNSNEQVNTIFMVSSDQQAGELMAGITRSNYQDGGASSTGDTLLVSIHFLVTAADSIPLTITRSSLIAPDGVTKYPHNVTNGYILSQDATEVPISSESESINRGIQVLNNYPNPFNATTSIDCRVFSREIVDIYILNLLGQRVKDIFNGILYPGDYSFVWDSNDMSGRPVCSGMYFIVFQWQNFTETRKTILLK